MFLKVRGNCLSEVRGKGKTGKYKTKITLVRISNDDNGKG
jgi:hypothetical protein